MAVCKECPTASQSEATADTEIWLFGTFHTHGITQDHLFHLVSSLSSEVLCFCNCWHKKEHASTAVYLSLLQVFNCAFAAPMADTTGK